MASVLTLLLQCATTSCSLEQFVFDNTFMIGSRVCNSMMKVYDLGLHLPFQRRINDDLDFVSIVWHSPYKTLQVKDPSRLSQLFDYEKPTVVIIHGFNSESTSMYPLADTFHKMGKYNMLLIEAKLVFRENYIHSAAMVKYVGKRISDFLSELFDFARYNPKKVHLIGNSLGAHVAGWTGHEFKSKTNERLGRITGLDPAGPCFSNTQLKDGLYKSDADFVEVLHVNKGLQGMTEAIGHVDFYVNGGGPNQPGCSTFNCSHMRGFDYYMEALENPDSFIGRKCNNWDDFKIGICDENDVLSIANYTSIKERGTYYLRTASNSPFALGINGTLG